MIGTLVTGALVAGSTAARAALASGTPLKTLAAADGSRYFGSDMTGNLLSNSTVTQLQAQQFNMVTPGNEMKWDTTEPSNGTFNFSPGDQIVSYAKANGEQVRCHNLVWQSQLPSWVSSLPASQVQAAMETHITTEAGHFKGECYAWDVVNEPFNGDGSFVADPFYNAMGSAYIADALRTAHAADPSAKLYLNDYSIEGENAKSNAMYSLAQSLLAQGVPLNGIGFESHFILGQVPSDMEANMQRFASLGLDVAVTELDDRITLPATSANLTQQATDFASVVKDCLGVSRCVGVTQWAVGDADSWVPGTFSGQGAATMFDQNYSAKPAFTAVQSALAGSAGSQNTVTVTNPGARTGTVGTAASLQVTATDSASGQTLAYTASGLPAGLAISTSGLITGTPTTAGSSTVTVTAKDATGASGNATFTWTISGGGSTGGGGACHVTYTKNSEWPGGFTAQVTIANTSTTALSSWSLTFTFPGDQKITSNFNGGFSQTGQNATLTNASYNGAIAPGASITDGFQGSWTSNDAAPTSFKVNGTTCG
ncbi:MAG TPA: endo-1,4-beta-xylanase [Trebonia sp.]|nr:endo-1,4-beta-xylanase [Trebonia sp.]